MCGSLVQDGEIVDQVLHILRREIDDPGKLAFVARIIEIEPFGDELRMIVIFREDDSLSQAIVAGDFKAARH